MYDLVKDEKKDAVVSILVDRLMSGKRPKQTFDSDTQVFEPGVLGSSPEGLVFFKPFYKFCVPVN